jgi:HD-like signal output (HDOD) protein/CheY-like chemotaxis protein
MTDPIRTPDADGSPILVVDDDPVTRRSVARMLGTLGRRAELAASIRDAIEVLGGGGAFEAMLLDIHLPDASGHLLVQQLEKLSVPLPIIAMSGRAGRDDLVLLMRHGALDFLEKPFRLKDLQEALDRLVQKRERAEAREEKRRRTHGDRPEEAGSGGDGPPAETETGVAPTAELPTEIVSRRLARGELELPALGPIAAGVQRLMHRETCGVQEVVAVIERDPSVTAQVLRASNTSYYRASREVETLREACVQLGNKRVLAVAQEALIAPLFTVEREPFGALSQAMWANVQVTAHGARALSVSLELLEPDEVFLAALLHNVGELLLLRAYRDAVLHTPEGVADLDAFADLARREHEAAGGALLKAWGTPTSVVRIARHHHGRPSRPESRSEVVRRQLVMLAWHGAVRAGYDCLPGQSTEMPSELLTGLGATERELDEVFGRAAEWLGQ